MLLRREFHYINIPKSQVIDGWKGVHVDMYVQRRKEGGKKGAGKHRRKDDMKIKVEKPHVLQLL